MFNLRLRPTAAVGAHAGIVKEAAAGGQGQLADVARATSPGALLDPSFLGVIKFQPDDVARA